MKRSSLPAVKTQNHHLAATSSRTSSGQVLERVLVTATYWQAPK